MLPDDTRHKIENITSGTIIKGQSEIHYATALQQVIRLKKISKVNQSQKKEQAQLQVPVKSRRI